MLDYTEGKRINIDSFDRFPILKSKLIRTNDYMKTAKWRNDYRYNPESKLPVGILLEDKEVDYSLENAGGLVPEKETLFGSFYTPFRGAIGCIRTLNSLFIICDVDRKNTSNYVVYDKAEVYIWVYCNDNTYDSKTKTCTFTAFDPLVVQHIEEGAMKKAPIYWNLGTGGDVRKYKISPTTDPRIFIQERIDNPNLQRTVLRIPLDEAKELVIKADIKAGIRKKPSEEVPNLALEVVTNSPIDVDRYDVLYKQGKYRSENYRKVLEQEKVFERLFSPIKKSDVYELLRTHDAFEKGLLIFFGDS